MPALCDGFAGDRNETLRQKSSWQCFFGNISLFLVPCTSMISHTQRGISQVRHCCDMVCLKSVTLCALDTTVCLLGGLHFPSYCEKQ